MITMQVWLISVGVKVCTKRGRTNVMCQLFRKRPSISLPLAVRAMHLSHVTITNGTESPVTTRPQKQTLLGDFGAFDCYREAQVDLA